MKIRANKQSGFTLPYHIHGKEGNQTHFKRIFTICMIIFINLLFLYPLEKDHYAYASLTKFIHSTCSYSNESGKALNLHLDGNMPTDINKYKIYLLKSQDINTPFTRIIDGDKWQFDPVDLVGNYLYTKYITKNFIYTSDWLSASTLEALIAREEIEYLYFTTREEGFCVIDLHDPENPEMKRIFPHERENPSWGIYYYRGAFCYDEERGYAYRNTERGIEVYNVSDPLNPVKMATLCYTGYVQTRGSIAYILYTDTLNENSDIFKAVDIVDITDPVNPQPLSTISIDQNFGSHFLDGDYLFLSSPDYSFTIFDIKDPNSPYEIKTYNGSLLPSGFGTWLLNIAFQRWGNYLCFLLTYSKGDYSFLYEYDSSAVMRLFDISDPLNLKDAGWGTIKAGCSPKDSECCMMRFSEFKVQDGYAYILREHPPNFVVAGKYPHERNIYTSYGLELYVVDLQDVIQKSSKEENLFMGEIDPLFVIPINGGSVLDFKIKDNYGYFSLAEGGIQIVEIPVKCSNLHWVDANTIGAEIAMPISPGTYQVVIEVEQEDKPAEGSQEGETPPSEETQNPPSNGDSKLGEIVDRIFHIFYSEYYDCCKEMLPILFAPYLPSIISSGYHLPVNLGQYNDSYKLYAPYPFRMKSSIYYSIPFYYPFALPWMLTGWYPSWIQPHTGYNNLLDFPFPVEEIGGYL